MGLPNYAAILIAIVFGAIIVGYFTYTAEDPSNGFVIGPLLGGILYFILWATVVEKFENRDD